jgi:hypothetical protein
VKRSHGTVWCGAQWNLSRVGPEDPAAVARNRYHYRRLQDGRTLGGIVDPKDRDWMTYIDAEVRALCQAKGWEHQIRRKTSVREEPVPDSPIDDYEWKLIPVTPGTKPEVQVDDYEGVYYVLRFDRPNDRFLFQHDTTHRGPVGPHFEHSTYTEFRPQAIWSGTHWPAMDFLRLSRRGALSDRPPEGWLRMHLELLTSRFKPNYFGWT